MEEILTRIADALERIADRLDEPVYIEPADEMKECFKLIAREIYYNGKELWIQTKGE